MNIKWHKPLRYCSYGLLSSTVILAWPAYSVDQVVNGNEIATKTLNAGDTLTVNLGGSVTANPAVNLTGNATITNHGLLTNAGQALLGTNADANPTTIRNTGTIRNTSGGALPIAANLTAMTAPVTFTNEGGTITGLVQLPTNTAPNLVSTLNVKNPATSAWGATGLQASSEVNITGSATLTTTANSTVFTNLDSVNITGADTNFTLSGAPNTTNTINNLNRLTVGSGATANLGTATTNAVVTTTQAITNGGTMTLAGRLGNSTTLASPNFTNTGKLTAQANVTFSGVLNLDSVTAVSGNIQKTAGQVLTVNIQRDYTTDGTINADNIVINGAQIFNIKHALTSANNFLIPAGTNVNMTNSITAPQTINSGVISLNNAQTVTGDYQQMPTGVFQTTLYKTGAGNFGKLTATGGVNLQGVVQVLLPDQGVHINDGDTFAIMTKGGAVPFADASTLVYPSSAVLSFTKTINGNDIRLTAARKKYDTINNIPAYEGISETLDKFRAPGTNPEIVSLLSAIDAQPNAAAFENALAQLTPSVHGGTLESSLIAQNLPLDKIRDRLDAMRAGVDLFKTGYSAGDMASGRGSYGPMVFANNSRQQKRENIEGYNALTGGFGFLGDVSISSNLKLGASISYAGTQVKSANANNAANNSTAINSIQGTLYSSIDYHPFFLDSMIACAQNRYTNKRVIAIINQTATGKFGGTQYTGKLRGGFVLFRFSGIEAAPLASIQYTQLKQNSYTETGAAGANLAVDAQNSKFAQVGLGIKIADTREAEEFYPEIHALILNDLKSPEIKATARFTQGGAPFTTQGPSPVKRGLNIGGSLTLLVGEDFLVTGGYDLDTKKSFISHSASLKCRWVF